MREQLSSLIGACLRLGRTFIRTHVRILIGLLVLLSLYAVLGFFLVPKIIRSQLGQFAAATLHRPLSIGEIRFNPFKLDASVSNFALTEADGAPLVALRHLYVNAQLASVWRRAIVLHALELSAPQVHVKIAVDGTVNLAKRIPKTPKDTDTEEPLAARIGHFAVREGGVGIEDVARAFNSTIDRGGTASPASPVFLGCRALRNASKARGDTYIPHVLNLLRGVCRDVLNCLTW
jgi:uncharacterized protein involved in outer membrane biogenesis